MRDAGCLQAGQRAYLQAVAGRLRCGGDGGRRASHHLRRVDGEVQGLEWRVRGVVEQARREGRRGGDEQRLDAMQCDVIWDRVAGSSGGQLD